MLSKNWQIIIVFWGHSVYTLVQTLKFDQIRIIGIHSTLDVYHFLVLETVKVFPSSYLTLFNIANSSYLVILKCCRTSRYSANSTALVRVNHPSFILIQFCVFPNCLGNQTGFLLLSLSHLNQNEISRGKKKNQWTHACNLWPWEAEAGALS